MRQRRHQGRADCLPPTNGLFASHTHAGARGEGGQARRVPAPHALPALPAQGIPSPSVPRGDRPAPSPPPPARPVPDRSDNRKPQATAHKAPRSHTAPLCLHHPWPGPPCRKDRGPREGALCPGWAYTPAQGRARRSTRPVYSGQPTWAPGVCTAHSCQWPQQLTLHPPF